MDTWAWHSCACWTSKGRSSLCAQENCHAGTKHIYRSENTLNLKSNIIIHNINISFMIFGQNWIGFCYWAIWIGLVFGLVLSCRPRTLFLMISWRTTEMSTDIQIFLKKRERVKKKIRRISWQASVKKSEQHVPFLMSDLLCVTNVLKIQLKWLLAWKKKKKTGSLNLFHVYFNFNYFSFPTSN